jgi:NAD(P)-dependent dehydrogenase (short-subunit alcohol dehydrogenase family)
MREVRGKVAVITGGASGIGLAMARRFAREGMKLVLGDIELGALAKVEAEFREQGAELLALQVDVSSGEQMEAFAARALEAFGAVHVVCNNAGVGAGGVMWELTHQDWEWVLGVNLWGVIHGIRLFVPHLVAQGDGHVVNTASIAGIGSVPGLGPYNVSKHAVVTLSETLYGELANQGIPVGVSVLCPAFVNTRIFEADRNRPESLMNPETPEGEEEAEARRELGAQLMASSMPAEQVADEVFDAVVQDRFYILPHAEAKLLAQARLSAIVEGRNPAAGPSLDSILEGGEED